MNVIYLIDRANNSNNLTAKALKDGVQQAAAAALTVQVYATAVVQQGDLNLDKVPELKTHQQLARQHAQNWLNNISGQMVSVNRDVADFSNTFNGYYKQLIELAEQIVNGDRTKVSIFTQGLKELDQKIVQKQNTVVAVIDSLNNFQNDIEGDVQNFDQDNQTIIAKITGDQGDIAQLQEAIRGLNSRISQDIGFIAGGSALVLFGGLTIAVGVLIVATGAGAPLGTGVIVAGVAMAGTGIAGITYGAIDLDKARKELKDKTEELTQEQLEVAAFTLVSGQLTALLDQGKAAISALNTLKGGWDNLRAGLQELINQLENNINTESVFLTSQLSTAKNEWDDVKKIADALQGFGQMPVTKEPIPA